MWHVSVLSAVLVMSTAPALAGRYTHWAKLIAQPVPAGER